MTKDEEIARLRAEGLRLRELLKQTVRLARAYAQKPTGSIFEKAMAEAEEASDE